MRAGDKETDTERERERERQREKILHTLAGVGAGFCISEASMPRFQLNRDEDK